MNDQLTKPGSTFGRIRHAPRAVPGSHRAAVVEAGVLMRDGSVPITRKGLIAALSGRVSNNALDEALLSLVDAGEWKRLMHGVYIIVEREREDRPISLTMIPPLCSAKLEVGDEVIDLSPGEARLLGTLAGGMGQGMTGMNIGRECMIALARSEELLAAARDRINALERDKRQLQEQIKSGGWGLQQGLPLDDGAGPVAVMA